MRDAENLRVTNNKT